MLKPSSTWRNDKSIRRGLVYGIFILCAYSAWMRAGVYTALQWPVMIPALAMGAALYVFPEERSKAIRSRIGRDPVFYAGAAFFLLLLIQWTNSGYGWVPGDQGMTPAAPETPPRWLPWSVDRAGPASMMIWLFPPFMILIVVRNVLSRSDAKRLLLLLVWNSALLACVGILLYIIDSDSILGIWDKPRWDSFATFDYPNHAAAWFYLHAGLCAGLAHAALSKSRPPVRIVIFGICFLCCTAASFLSLSRIGAFFSFIQLTVVLVILLLRTRRYLRGAAAVNTYIAIGIVGLIGMASFYGAGGGHLAREIAGKPVFGEHSIQNDMVSRMAHATTTWRIIGDYPLFGCGAWGVDEWVSVHVPAEEVRSWIVCGRAQSHCDPVQFLAEFGIIGASLLGMIVVVLVHEVLKSRRSILTFWVSGALLAVLLHSVIDLPFRCPAVLTAWCCLLAALPVRTDYTRSARHKN